MIDIKEAIDSAVAKFSELYSKSGYRDIKLEEVELTDDDKYWLITISYMLPQNETETALETAASDLLKNLAQMRKYQRDFKTIQIDADTGAFRSMKITSPVAKAS